MELPTLFGRESDLDHLWARIEEEPVLFLGGARGVGKTLLLEHAAARPRSGFTALLLPLDGASTLQDALSLLRDRINEVGWLSRWRDEFLGREVDPLRRLDDLLVRRPESERLVLFFDEIPWWIDRLGSRTAEVVEWLGRIGRRLGPDTRLVITGSIGLQPLARQVGVSVVANPWTLAPIALGAGQAVFVRACAQACDDEASALAWREAGGLPRWIERLGQKTVAPHNRLVSTDDLSAAIEAIVADPATFGAELDHLRRYPTYRHHLERALCAAAENGSTAATVAAALQQGGVSRAAVGSLLELLREDQFLADDLLSFQLPLLRLWLRRHRCR